MLKITINDNQAIQKLTSIANQLEKPRQLYGLLGETLKKFMMPALKLRLIQKVIAGKRYRHAQKR